MKLLQILVWILLFVASYDFIRYFLIQTSEAELAVGEEVVREEKHTIFGYDGSELEPLLQWWVGGACLVVLYLVRALFRRLLPFASSVSRTKVEPTQVKKRESFLTCRISDTTINTYTDDQNFDIPGQLSPAQLQVLLEELKFSVDEKFEEIDSWIATNGQELKLWSKRLERVETELSYIRHQIFILMSSNAKVRPNLCVGDVPDTRNHVETLRDLSTILAQVKQQFHENEKGIKVRDCGDHRENYLLVNTEPIVLQEVNEGNERNFIELKNVEAEQKFMILKELKATQGKKKAQELLPEAKKNCVKEEIVPVQHNYLNKSESLETLSSGRYESNSTTQSEKDDFISIYENEQNVNEKWDAPARTEVKNLESPRNENGPDRRSRSPSPKSPRIDIADRPQSPRIDIADRPQSPNKCNNSSDRKSKVFQENTPPVVAEEEPSPTDLIYNNDPPTQPDTQNKVSKPSTKETSPRSPSPRRTVRFAQEKRDVSPSKTPTWLGINRDSLQVKSNEIKGSSDSKVGSPTYNEALRPNRDSASCPLVEDKRQSRRSIMEKELTNLERRVSPSPTRNRQNRRPNVRSKVGDYIRGAKY